VNPSLGGVDFRLERHAHTQDELFAAIVRYRSSHSGSSSKGWKVGHTVNRIINGGGIPQRNAVLNRVYAKS